MYTEERVDSKEGGIEPEGIQQNNTIAKGGPNRSHSSDINLTSNQFMQEKNKISEWFHDDNFVSLVEYSKEEKFQMDLEV